MRLDGYSLNCLALYCLNDNDYIIYNDYIILITFLLYYYIIMIILFIHIKLLTK